jgi:D-3-phosphoglycerate dehydrogenase
MTDASPSFRILAADRKKAFRLFDERVAEIGGEMVYGAAETPEAMDPYVADADAVMVFRTHITADQISKMKRCKLLLRQGIGFDLIDVPAATRAGIFVSNVPDYCIDEVADHAITLLLATVRNLLDYHRVTTKEGWGFWNTSRKIPSSCDMTIGIVGLGKIGRAFARRAAAFGFTLQGYDPYIHDDIFEAQGVRRIRQLDDLLATSDAVSLHAPLTPETRNLFGEREFGLMKEGCYFINTARGRIVDLSALDAALASGRLAAAGLDVFENEPLNADHPILQRPNLVATPHVAFYSERSIRRAASESIDEVIRVLQGARPLNLVNPEVYDYRRSSI